MNEKDDTTSESHQRPAWQFILALVIVLGGVVVGTLLIIPRAEKRSNRPTVSQPAPFVPKPTNQVIIRDQPDALTK